MGGTGSGGKNKKTVFQHIQDGTYRKDRHGPRPRLDESTADDAAVLSKDMQPSEWMSETAKQYFTELAPDLIELGTLTALNLRVFEGLCTTLAHIQEITIMLDKEGTVINGKPHPMLRLHSQLVGSSLELFKYFGMTPLARMKLGFDNKNTPSADPMEALFTSRKLY